MKFYIFYSGCDVLFLVKNSFLHIKQHLSLMMPLSVLSLTSSVLPTAYYDIYENVKYISYHIYKEIHMNILYMMTKTCTYINFYTVNINYL